MSLNEYLQLADAIHKNVINNVAFMSAGQIESQMIELEKYIRKIQSVSLRILHIYQSCKRATLTYKNISDNYDPYPDNDEWTQTYKERQIIRPIKDAPQINANILESPEDVPNMTISWIRSLNQFAFRLNGVLFRGNIGEILHKHDMKSAARIYTCKKPQCKNYLNGRCKKYHDPLLYSGSTDIRNFINSSWIYTRDPPKKGNLMMRHFGDRNDLMHKIRIINNPSMVNMFMGQVIHDILVALVLDATKKESERGD